MNETLEAGSVGIVVKVLVDLLRAVAPKIEKRWVHLAALIPCAVYVAVLVWQKPDELATAVSGGLAAFLVAIGANEATRRVV